VTLRVDIEIQNATRAAGAIFMNDEPEHCMPIFMRLRFEKIAYLIKIIFKNDQ